MQKRAIAKVLMPVSRPEQERREEEVRRNFWDHLRRFAGRIPFATDLVAAYYCAMDPETPFRVKGTLLAALAYFVLPIDVLPDLLVLVGFTDDLAVLMAAIGLVSSHMSEEHYAKARETLEQDDDLPDPDQSKAG